MQANVRERPRLAASGYPAHGPGVQSPESRVIVIGWPAGYGDGVAALASDNNA